MPWYLLSKAQNCYQILKVSIIKTLVIINKQTSEKVATIKVLPFNQVHNLLRKVKLLNDAFSILQKTPFLFYTILSYIRTYVYIICFML